MSVLVAIIGNDFARAHEFTACAMNLETPPGSEKRMLIGGDWCGARNTLAAECLDNDYTHLWFMDDDHSFAPDLLMRLLAWDKDLVTPVCLTRVFPFTPVSYVPAPEGHPADFLPIDLADCPSSGLVKIAAGGCAGMLIKREVLEATRLSEEWDGYSGSVFVKDRWFEYGDRSEDIVFCEKAIRAGYEIYADLGARLGHITTAVAIPDWDEENGWTTRMRIGSSYDVRVKNAYDLVGRDTYVEAAAVSVGEFEKPPIITPPEPEEEDDYYYREPVEVPADAQVLRTAERIEIWQAEDASGRLIWWWRAIDDEGVVLAKNSALREPELIAQATAAYPECVDSVYQVARELDDSRNVQQFGPPRRLWNREPT